MARRQGQDQAERQKDKGDAYFSGEGMSSSKDLIDLLYISDPVEYPALHQRRPASLDFEVSARLSGSNPFTALSSWLGAGYAIWRIVKHLCGWGFGP